MKGRKKIEFKKIKERRPDLATREERVKSLLFRRGEKEWREKKSFPCMDVKEERLP